MSIENASLIDIHLLAVVMKTTVCFWCVYISAKAYSLCDGMKRANMAFVVTYL